MPKLGIVWSKLGIVLRYHMGYNQFKEKMQISKNWKLFSENVEKSIDISEIAEYTNSRTSVR